MVELKMALIIIVSIICLELDGQSTSDEYWDALGIATKYYDAADYSNAAKAFEVVWTKENKKEMANHRLYAAAANCMVDNEEGVKENLFKLIEVAGKIDRKRVLVNYQIFDKYKKRSWWAELKKGLNERISKLIAHHKNLKIFKHHRNITYSAIRINSVGDTLANTHITVIPDGTGWGDEASTSQSQVIYKYKSTIQDSMKSFNEVDSVVGGRFWKNIDTSGVIENASEIWIHPFRNNEFYKTEIAPFPTVKLPLSDSLMRTIKSSTHIMNDWGLYTRTETKESFSYLGKESKSYNSMGEMECHKLKGVAENSRYGRSVLEYYFHEEYGFTEMNYLTYDGDRIEFKIIKVDNTE